MFIYRPSYFFLTALRSTHTVRLLLSVRIINSKEINRSSNVTLKKRAIILRSIVKVLVSEDVGDNRV